MPGHLSTHCTQPRREGGVGRGRGRGGNVAALIALGVHDEVNLHNVYLTIGLNGKNRSFLLDSGCDMTLLPLKYVKRWQVTPTTKTVTAANGADIPLAGEVKVILVLGSLRIMTPALVSEFVHEGMLGHDWMRDNNCYWGFRSGQVMIQTKTFDLEGRRQPGERCCRVLAQEDMTVSSRSEMVMSGKMIIDKVQERNLGDLITCSGVLENGLYVARVVVPHQCNNVPVRILNVTERDILVKKGDVISELESVQVISPNSTVPERDSNTNDEWKEDLLRRVSGEIKGKDRKELRKILTEYEDCFSKSEFDFGRTNIATTAAACSG